jgi:hypothetical protein
VESPVAAPVTAAPVALVVETFEPTLLAPELLLSTLSPVAAVPLNEPATSKEGEKAAKEKDAVEAPVAAPVTAAPVPVPVAEVISLTFSLSPVVAPVAEPVVTKGIRGEKTKKVETTVEPVVAKEDPVNDELEEPSVETEEKEAKEAKNGRRR